MSDRRAWAWASRMVGRRERWEGVAAKAALVPQPAGVVPLALARGKLGGSSPLPSPDLTALAGGRCWRVKWRAPWCAPLTPNARLLAAAFPMGRGLRREICVRGWGGGSVAGHGKRTRCADGTGQLDSRPERAGVILAYPGWFFLRSAPEKKMRRTAETRKKHSSSEKVSLFGTVALSFVCDKYYLIID